ncbi:MAG: type II toxin-antitoxin system RelE/ParE family toxin [Geminicoccaceae bacterium]
MQHAPTWRSEAFGTKACAVCGEQDDSRGVPAQSTARLRRMMAAINQTSAPEKLAAAALPGWRMHTLKGDLAGHWSSSVTGNRRLIVRFEGGDAFDLDLVDYH